MTVSILGLAALMFGVAAYFVVPRIQARPRAAALPMEQERSTEGERDTEDDRSWMSGLLHGGGIAIGLGAVILVAHLVGGLAGSLSVGIVMVGYFLLVR